jgi:hypothetical protein
MISKYQKVRRLAVSILLGAAVGLTIHYYLYRIGLPVQPFIYQAF